MRVWAKLASNPLDGVLGAFTLGGPGLQALWPWLWAGQWLGLGKGATQGLGLLRLSATASLPENAAPAQASYLLPQEEHASR